MWKMENSTSEQESDMKLDPKSASVDKGTSSVPEDRLVDRPNAKAAVWQYFALETDEYGVILKKTSCRYAKWGGCLAQVNIKHVSTRNLYSHLRMQHPHEYQAVRP